MSEIKVGDTVERIKADHCGMKVGDIGTVTYSGDGINLKEFRGLHDEANFKVVKQTKTVADAYEEHKTWDSIENYYGGSAEGEDFVLWSKDRESFEQGCEGYSEELYHKVCTREQFEAYAKEQEAKQEGEKWTHMYDADKCYIKVSEPDEDGYIMIVTEYNGYQLCMPDDLKPIKPKLTKANEAALVEFMKSSHKLEVINEVRAYIREHDII